MPAILLDKKNDTEETKPVAEETEASTHTTAFLVLVNKDGSFSLEPDINKIVIPERKATGSEIKSALQTIMLDIQIQETALLAAQATMSLQEQRMRAMMEAQQNAQVLQQLGKK